MTNSDRVSQLSEKAQSMLLTMKLVEEYSALPHTTSWIWGGFTADILENRFFREHDDLDYLTLHLHDLIPGFVKLFEKKGWQTKVLENGDLKIRRGDINIQLGHVEMSNRARWAHNGATGSIWFPKEWLSTRARPFYGTKVHVVGPELQYVLLERPQMLNSAWRCRDKDIPAKRYLRSCIEQKRIDPQTLLQAVSDQENNLLHPEKEVL